MDSTSAPPPPPSYQAAPEIPSDIFRPLLAIAQRQYEANDVKQYYLIMLRHLRRMGTVNADAAYTILSPISDKKAPPPGMEGVQVVRTLDDGQVSPKTNPMNAEPSFEPSYEPGQNDQLQIATSSQQTYPVLNEVSRQIEAEMPPTLPPRHDSQQFCESPPQDMLMMLPTTSSQHDPNAIRAASLPTQPFGTPHQPVLQPWASHEQYHLSPYQGHQQPRGFVQQFAPTPVPYHASVSNTPMPMHNPFSPPPQHQQMPQQYQQQQYQQWHQQHPQQHPQEQVYESEQEGFLGPLGNSLGLSRLADNFADEFYGSPLGPMIDVIPSRKRRKALMQKGVRRFTGVM